MPQNIAVIGLGYIGLPLSLTLCEKGFRVIGVDISEGKIQELLEGSTNVHEDYNGISLETLLRKHLESQTFVPTTRVEAAAAEADTYVVTVGLPVADDDGVDESPILGMAEQLGRVLKHGDLVLIRSTLIPGMMEKKIIPALEMSSRMIAGTDFHVAYAAERVAEGRAMIEFQTLDVVVAGLTDRCAERAVSVLQRLTSGKIHVTDLRVAQAVKVIENAQRDVNIALAQQIAAYARYHDMDVYELIRMANTHPRVHLLEPGIGVGGFCIPNAYHYLKASLEENMQGLPLFEWARSVNESTPERFVNEMEAQFLAAGKKFENATVAVLGLGMKDYSNDIRLSPAVRYIDVLLRKGAVVRAFDPTVPVQLAVQSGSLEDCVRGVDGIIVGAWQKEFETVDFRSLLASEHVVGLIDPRNRIRKYISTLSADGTSSDLVSIGGV